MEQQSLFKTLSSASFLLMLISVLIFLFTQSFAAGSAFAPLNTILIGYTVIFGIVLTGTLIYSPKTISDLVKANYWKSFGLKFIPSAIVVSVFLFLIKTLIKGSQGLNFIQGISNIPLPILLVHLFVITQIEELMFNGMIYNALKAKSGDNSANVVSTLFFSVFHWGRSGGNIFMLLTYIPLRLWWNYSNQFGTPLLNKIPGIGQTLFGPTPGTSQNGGGAHFAWNMFVIGFIQPFQA